jgi:hypothetical protein
MLFTNKAAIARCQSMLLSRILQSFDKAPPYHAHSTTTTAALPTTKQSMSITSTTSRTHPSNSPFVSHLPIDRCRPSKIILLRRLDNVWEYLCNLPRKGVGWGGRRWSSCPDGLLPHQHPPIHTVPGSHLTSQSLKFHLSTCACTVPSQGALSPLARYEVAKRELQQIRGCKCTELMIYEVKE